MSDLLIYLAIFIGGGIVGVWLFLWWVGPQLFTGWRMW